MRASGREIALIFVLKSRRVVEVRAQDIWKNLDAPEGLIETGLTSNGRTA